MKRFLWIGLFLTTVCTGGNALAADFTLTIPVTLSAIPPEVNRFHVGCWMYAPAWNTIGRETVSIPAGGSFNGNISVEVNARPGKNPAELTHYECKGHFTGNVAGGTAHFFLNAGSPTFPLAPNLPFVLHIPKTPLG